MIIESVLRKDEYTVIVYFDNNQKLILSEEVFFNSSLRKGDEVSDDRFSYFIEQNIIYHIKQKALLLLVRRYHSEIELLIKLKSKSYDEKLIKIVLNDLIEKGFIDDYIFAKHFIEEKLNSKKWGKNKIKSALFSKGVNGSTVDQVMNEFFNDKNDFDLAFEFAEKKLIQLKKRNTDPKKYYQKITAFLLSRGISYETIQDVCQKILKEDIS